MEEVLHIVSPLSAVWTGWAMLALLLSAVLSEWLQPGIISQSAGSLVVRAERSYKDAPANNVGQLLISLFRIGTIAMGICLCLEPEGRFSFVSFAIVMGLIFSVILLKILCNLLLNYTLTYNGQTPECTPAQTLAYVKSTANILRGRQKERVWCYSRLE